MSFAELAGLPIAPVCGAPGHDAFFRHDIGARRRILTLARYAMAQGISAFMAREYPAPREKGIIINVIGGRMYCVDGNCHLVSLIVAKPDLCFGELMGYAPGVIRLWLEGLEEAHGNTAPYDVYIPFRISTDRIPGAGIGMDCFKPVPERIRILPAHIPFDSPLFLPQDRGCPLYQTALFVLGEEKTA